jgi:phosphoglycolate phosphatase
MLPPSSVVFDLDGTLIDSRGDIVAALNHALLHKGKKALPAQVVVRYVGDGARTLCARAAQLPESADEVEELLTLFLDYYVAHPVDFTRWMPGAQEALDELGALNDLALGICTNKPRVTTDAVLAALGVRTRFRAIFAGGDLSEKKPAPGPLLHVAKLLNLPVERMVMVGDAPQDIECARRAGMRVIAVERGFATTERVRDARPDVTLESLAELPEVIRRWRDATARVSLR